MYIYIKTLLLLLFFPAHLFSCRVQVSRPKEGAVLRREAEAAGAREVSQREDGQGARGCGRRRGVEAHGAEVALIATARCTAQARSAHQRRCHPEHLARAH